MQRIFIALVGLLLVIATACGDDDASSTTAATIQATTAAPSGDESGPSTSASPTTNAPTTTREAPSGASNDFCRAIEGVDTDEFGFGMDPDTLRDSVQQTLSAMRQVQSSAPSEIRDDLSILIDGFAGFVELLEEVDYNFLALGASAATDPRITRFEEQEFIDAAERVGAYCGIDLDLGSGSGDAPDVPDVPGLPDMSNEIPVGFPAEIVPPGVTSVLDMGGGAVLFTTASTFADLESFYSNLLGAPDFSDTNADLAFWTTSSVPGVLGVAISPGSGTIDVLVTLNP